MAIYAEKEAGPFKDRETTSIGTLAQGIVGTRAANYEDEKSCDTETPTLDALKNARTHAIRMHSNRLKELNRIIAALEASDAERIVKEAKELLRTQF